MSISRFFWALLAVSCVHKTESPPDDEQTTVAATMPADAGASKAPDEDTPPAPKDDPKPAPCGASFAKAVVPAFDEAGCAAIQCHGTRLARGVRIEVDDPALTYESFTAFAIDGKPYVKAGATRPEDSSITCHLAGQCGVKMPPLTGVVPNSLVTAVHAWLACGAPNN